MINRESIWNETHKSDRIYTEGARIEVMTAIHHYTSISGASRLDLCSDLSISVNSGEANMRVSCKMTADQMIKLADNLVISAERASKLQQMLADEEAEIANAAAEAIGQAKEAA